jgi:hypothetical protein
MVLRFWVENKTGSDDYTRVRVHSCVQRAGSWIVSYSVLGSLSARMNRWLQHG